MQHVGHRFVVTSGMLHDHAGFPFNGFQLLDQTGKALGAVVYFKGNPNHFSKRPQHCDSALSAGNINTCCVHLQHSQNQFAMDEGHLFPLPIPSVC